MEDCRSCPIDCGCGDNGKCLEDDKGADVCYPIKDSSEHFKIWLADANQVPIREKTISPAGKAVKLRIYTQNKEKSSLICKTWTLKDNVINDIRSYSLSSIEIGYDFFTESASSFIVDENQKIIDLEFAVWCHNTNNKINETILLKHQLIFLPQ